MTWNSLWRHSITLIFILSSFVSIAEAKQIPARPSPARLVNDFARLLSSQERRILERKLVNYNDSTSTQIAIVIENSLDGDDIFDYTIRLAEQWGIGQQDKDNGILIFVASGDRRLRILTGYGTEGFLPDATAKRIVDGIIVPKFKQGQFYQGLNRATDAIIKLGSGEYTADDIGRRNNEGGIPPLAIFIIIVVVFIIIANRNNHQNYHDDDDDDGGYYRGGRYERMPRRRRGGGGWVFIPGPGSGGGGWNPGGGGFDGGGFGGFGGGSFGGGGAGGSW